jgi:hypothetical protein
LIAAALLALSAPSALADPLVYNPGGPGYHPGSPAHYYRYLASPDWFERRDTITLQAGDAVAANQTMQMRDPWPPYVNNQHILFHGEVMAGAIERYKTDEVKEWEILTIETSETQ